MQNVQFGSGTVLFAPNAGNLAANPTPYTAGIIQEASVDFKASLKSLFGQQQMAVATARGKVETTGKAKLAIFDVSFLNQMYLGQTQTVGSFRIVPNESRVAAASVVVSQIQSPVTPITDYGVTNGLTGQQMTNCGSGTPAAGQYKFTAATGTYVFSAADIAANLPVFLAYGYNSATLGGTITIANQLMGYAPVVQMVLYNQFRGKLFVIQLNACTLGSVSIATKQEDFWTCDVDFAANVDGSGNLGAMYGDLY